MTTTDPTFTPGERSSVRIERSFAHPIEQVWEAVTRPEHLRHWFPTEVTFELRAGGTARYVWEHGEADGADPSVGEVLEVDPPHLLVFTWGDDHLRFELAAEGDGTRFVLVHGFADRAGAASFAAGWEACLAGLGPVMADEPLPPATRMVDRHEELVAAFGLDQATVTEAGGRWTLRWERQLTCPADVARDRFGPTDDVRLELLEGTGHGARLVLTATGTGTAERDAAEARWGEVVAHVAAEGARWAHADAGTGADQ